MKSMVIEEKKIENKSCPSACSPIRPKNDRSKAGTKPDETK